MYKVNEIFYDDNEYSARAVFCNEHGYIIAEIDADEKGRRFQIQEPPAPTEDEKLSALRSERATLLSAFDKWEKAVLRGRQTDDKSVMFWYNKILDLEKDAFENIPEVVRYYL